MSRNNILGFLLAALFTGSSLFDLPCFSQVLPSNIINHDPLAENQGLYNGEMWRNLYSMVKGDQFFLSPEYLQGSLTMNGITYNDILINYDIYNDEILTPKRNEFIIQLNKEMVDSFSIYFGDKKYKFINANNDSLPGIKGYIKVLYQGKSALYVKYKKEIEALAVEDKYDLFFRTYRIFLVKERHVNLISTKSGLLKVLQDEKTRIREYMKKNKLKVLKTDPESFVPIIRYYDSLSR